MQHFDDHLEGLLGLLQELVERESPSTEKAAVDALGEFVAGRMQALGAQIERFPQEEHGDHWLGSWGQGGDGILILVHLDTVHPLGALRDMPWRRDAHFVYGPGCLDMKASLAICLTVIDQLQQGKLPTDRIKLLCTSDEETGSSSSRPLIERLAQQHALVLCLEPALPDGSLKTWRKGILNFHLEARGQAAHAGSDLPAGTNAIVEIAHQVPALLALTDETLETTLNLGRIEGGTRSNVVPDRCALAVDVRAKTWQEGERVRAAMKALEPVLPGAQLIIQGGWNRPPMERDERMRKTFQRAAEIGRDAGIELSEGGTGGGSDANFVAHLGVPVLDGLGAIGSGAHSPQERVEIGSLPSRCALLAALLSTW